MDRRHLLEYKRLIEWYAYVLDTFNDIILECHISMSRVHALPVWQSYHNVLPVEPRLCLSQQLIMFFAPDPRHIALDLDPWHTHFLTVRQVSISSWEYTKLLVVNNRDVTWVDGNELVLLVKVPHESCAPVFRSLFQRTCRTGSPTLRRPRCCSGAVQNVG